MPTNILKTAASLAFAFAATQAFAHAQLEKATPPVGGTVASPNEIRLEFSEGVEPKFTKVTLTGPGGATVPLGSATTEAGNQAVLIVPIAKPLAAGGYKVHWQAVSVDTHHTQGTFEFIVKP
jgi:methionine-rich copper-binding protein CopC